MSTAPTGYRYTPREHSAVLEHFVDQLNAVQNPGVVFPAFCDTMGLRLSVRRPSPPDPAW